MKPGLLKWLCCPVCRSELALAAARTDAEEVVEGSLGCNRCGQRYAIRDGVPRMIRPLDASRRDDRVTAHTADMFGYAWSQTRVADVHRPRPWHYAKMERALELDAIRGLVLDA